ncbi:MAG: DUF4382 domain-containing protein [Actinobacteria bacterium]|nr:DUF4382 domain-containing protein [Actinomycetota bacterium]
MKKATWLVCVLTAVLIVAAIAAAGCGSSDSAEDSDKGTAASGTGTLVFTANGEEFAREGFTSRDGWNLSFQHFYITLADVAAYQTDPPYDSEEGWEIDPVEEVNLSGTHTIDLVGAEANPVVEVGEVTDAPAGTYNAISWDVVKAGSGEPAGYAIVLAGTAEKEGQTLNFTIKFPAEYAFQGGEYVGDERKGILEDGGTADVEMTFHLDHLFGDIETEAGDALNVDALGFDPFAALAVNGVVDIDTAAMTPENIEKLNTILLGFGHVGEGHCASKPVEQESGNE